MLRLVLFNKDERFTVAQAAYRARVPKASARKELELFASIHLLKKQKQGREVAYRLNPSFEHYDALKIFFRRTTDVKHKDVAKAVRGCGAIKLLVLSGTLTDTVESSVDILIVGDKIQQGKVDRVIRSLEAELGQELSYAVFTSQDFSYRLGVYDRLLRDVLEYPKVVLIDTIGATR